MARVGILEQFYHSHIAYQLAAAAEAAGHDVSLYVSAPVRERIDEFGTLGAEVIERREGEALDAYLSRIEPAAADLDLLWIGTVAHLKEHTNPTEPYRSFFEFNPGCPVIYSIYGVNTWLDDQRVTGADATRNAYRRQLAARADGLVVQYSPWKAYADRLGSPAPILEYPYPIHEPGEASGDDEHVDVVLPGALARRDFEPVAQAFIWAWTHGLPVSLTVIASGEGYADVFEAASRHGWPIHIRDDYLPRPEYDAAVREADVILAPLRKTVTQRGFTECMGHTTGSGVIFDAIRVGRPLVLPAFFPLGWELEEHGVLTYGSAESFQTSLARLVDEDDLLPALKRGARQNASAFALERQAERFDALVSSVVGKSRPKVR